MLWALDKIHPRLPAGHLPISGWIDFCSVSLTKNPGCVYYWDEFAAPRTRQDADGETIFNSAHAILVAGSFNEFLTRLAITKDPYESEESEEPVGAKPLLALVRHSHVDAGTLMQIFWNGSAEDYYLFHCTAAEIDGEFESGVFQVLVQIERRFLKGDIKTAAIPFDPTERITMPERRAEFARKIPDVMYQPILGGKPRKR